MEDFVLESTEKWKKIVDINMMGVFYGTQIAIQELKKNDKGGLIINTASAGNITSNHITFEPPLIISYLLKFINLQTIHG